LLLLLLLYLGHSTAATTTGIVTTAAGTACLSLIRRRLLSLRRLLDCVVWRERAKLVVQVQSCQVVHRARGRHFRPQRFLRLPRHAVGPLLRLFGAVRFEEQVLLRRRATNPHAPRQLSRLSCPPATSLAAVAPLPNPHYRRRLFVSHTTAPTFPAAAAAAAPAPVNDVCPHGVAGGVYSVGATTATLWSIFF